VLWVPELKRSGLSVSKIEKKGYHIFFQDGKVLLVPRRYSFRSAVVLGVREGNLYRLRSQLMQAVTNSSRETDEEKHIAPSVVRQASPPVAQVWREQIDPPVVQALRELEFRGSQPSRSNREE
jgi:hypothetical protein